MSQVARQCALAAVGCLLLAGCAPKGAARAGRTDLPERLPEALRQLALEEPQRRQVEQVLSETRSAAGGLGEDEETERTELWNKAFRRIVFEALAEPQASRLCQVMGLTDYRRIVRQSEEMLARIRGHARALADLGPRQTGQEGCDRALEYVRRELSRIGPADKIAEFATEVTVALDRRRPEDLARADEPFTHVVLEAPGGSRHAWPAYALAPNCVQACRTHPADACPLRADGSAPCPHCERPRRLVYLGYGDWEQFRGKDLTGAVVLLEFNSGDAWLRAASLGAYGAIFIEPDRTTLFQADAKYCANLPLRFPRVYVRREVGENLRRIAWTAELARGFARAADSLSGAVLPAEGALAAAEPRITLRVRLRFQNVPAKCIELTIPGKNREYAFVFAAHLDARCIAPDLAYGGSEVWGIAETIELVRHFAENPPACDIHVIFVTGHWQGQLPMRHYIARDRRGKDFQRIGQYFRIAMALDLAPEGQSVNLMTESPWDVQATRAYRWLGFQLFRTDGWREETFRNLSLDAGVELLGGVRPTMSETGEEALANRNDRSPLVYAPRYPTAEQAFQALGLTTFAFQTGRLARLAHNTPLDRLSDADAAPDAVDARLRPQLQITLSVLQHLLDYPPNLLPKSSPGRRSGKTWGGYAQISGRIMQWDRSIGWFAGRLPGSEGDPARPAATAPGAERFQTLLYAYPTDSTFTNLIGSRLRNFLHWPTNPTRGQHRELQSFMFQDLLLLDGPDFVVPLVYAGQPQTQYDVVAYTLDSAGEIRFATDYGIHGDGNKAFQCTDIDLDTWDLYVPVSLFECGTLELFGLIDPQRYNPNAEVFGSWFQTYMIHGDHADRGVAPYLRIMGVKDVDSHTDLERWGFTQYGPTAMVFLPADFQIGAEVLIGSFFTNFAVLNNPDSRGRAVGYAVAAGQTIRLTQQDRPTPLVCLEQLSALDTRRIAEFARHDVASPLANRYHQESLDALAIARREQARGDPRRFLAEVARAWIAESAAYRNVLRLLVDVVSTTVLYFVLLIPFSFLLERLVLPQRTVVRTALVSASIFVVFAGLLYLFHPGFKLAHNVVVTTTAFVIVVMTVPALVLLLVRGVAMLRAIGSKAVITQQSEAESAGVVMAALSLAVSNMRRRRLRTALTLITITTLVGALVLLTTSSAFDFPILEPASGEAAGFQGVQVYNARDRRQPLLKEIVQVYEAALADEALVLRRECVNYGYDHKTDSGNGALYLQFRGRRTRVPYFQLMDYRDDLLEYNYVFYEDVPVPGHDKPVSTPRNVRVRLSDLLSERFAGKGDFINPPEFGGQGRFLEPGDVDVCILPNTMAEELGATVGDTVTLMHLPLKVKGIFRAQTEQVQTDDDGRQKQVFIPGPIDGLKDLDGLPITAMRSSMWREGEPDNPRHAPSNEVVIVPRAFLARYRLFPSCVYSMIVVPNGSDSEPARIGAWAEKLAKEILNVEVFCHYETPVVDARTGQPASQSHFNRISMVTATRVKGSSMMLVVIVVAVLMILAIMTGTVYERMREIHIFSSVGLSPRHVAGMFLIEALVYAGIAAVLGYFFGIISLKGLLAHLKATGQYQDFYPNYLGVFVLYSIGVAVLATLASSLYPIRLAGKIVNPSAGKTWQLQTEGEEAGSEDLWRIRLPFIATTWDEVRAMMVYAHDYLAMHQGERSGRFVCQRPPAGWTEGQTVRLQMPVWLAPFERNLTQEAALLARPTGDRAWWEMALELERQSGPPYLWRRGATVFVNMLCKHLLRWRAATPAQEADCLKRSDDIFPARGGQGGPPA